MKLVFNKLETPATEIKVAFDGVNYKSYNVNEIKTNGFISFTEEECPDLTKVKIQGKFSTLGSVEVNKAVELERGEGGESGIKFTKWYCFQHIDGYQALNDEVYCNHLPESWYYGMEDVPVIYEKNEDGEFVEAPYQPFNGGGDVEGIDYDFFVYYGSNREGFFKRYEEGDITEVITEIQEEPTITENGQTVADEGKAFKSVNVKSGISCTFEKDVFEETKYYCFAFDADNNGEIDSNDEIAWNEHLWLKDEISEDAEPFYCESEGIPNSLIDLKSIWAENPNEKVWFIDENTIGGIYDPNNPALDAGYRWKRYPEGDFVENVKVGTETVTEVITDIQDEPTITENGQIIADEGKAFKSVKVNGVAKLYKYSFDYGDSWNNEVYSTLNKPFLEEGDLVMSIDGCWGGISIWQLDSNEMKIPEFPKFIGNITLAEIMQKNIAASNQPH